MTEGIHRRRQEWEASFAYISRDKSALSWASVGAWMCLWRLPPFAVLLAMIVNDVDTMTINRVILNSLCVLHHHARARMCVLECPWRVFTVNFDCLHVFVHSKQVTKTIVCTLLFMIPRVNCLQMTHLGLFLMVVVHSARLQHPESTQNEIQRHKQV